MIAVQGFEPVSGWHAKIDEFVGGVEHVELAQDSLPSVGWDAFRSGRPLSVKERLRGGIAEGHEHLLEPGSFTGAVQA